MKFIALRRTAVAAALIVCGCGQIAWAEEKPAKLHRVKPASATTAPSTRQLAYDWNGFYVGVSAGKAWGSFDPLTSTAVSPTYLFRPEDVAAVNAAGRQDISPSGFMAGVQAGYNQQVGPVVLGLESGLDYLHLSGEANSGAIRYPGGGSGYGSSGGGHFYPFNQFVISTYDHANWVFTLRPRLGVPVGNWLFYGTGGLALTNLNGEFIFTDYNAADQALGAYQNGAVNTLKTGYAVGGGVEAGITDRLSVRVEYLFVDFGRVNAHQVDSNFATFFTPPAAQSFAESMDLRASLLRVGLNYRFGVADPTAPGAGLWMQYRGPDAPAPMFDPSNWQLDVGARLWLSKGSVGAPDPLLSFPPAPSSMNSRLTYVDQNAYSGETFARIDHRSGFFVKGFIGAGGVTSGTFYDEDFPGDRAYSNTYQTDTGSLAYATIDAGYSFLNGPGARVGAFVGYNFYANHIDTFGCTQIAGDDICKPASLPGDAGLEEDDKFNSLRVGLTSDVMLTDKLKLTAEAAYLPWVSFSGLDNHDWRELQLPESGTKGDGVMLETILSYAVTNNWSVGVGGRYWAWNMHEGTVGFDFLGLPPNPIQLARYNAERYGFFLQTDYRFGDPAPQTSSGAAFPVEAPPAPAAIAVNWTGLFVGGDVGGGFSNESWSDPFGSTPRGVGFVNVAGFGDTIHNTGPLAGVQAGANWQTGHLVLGIEGAWSTADLRGENTCFTGLGGLNCQHVINSMENVAARAGFAWDRSMFYAKGGVAWFNSTYTVLGDTAGRNLGVGNATLTSDGWLAGVGIEYAITNHWTASLEFNHVGVGSISVPFPTVALVRAQNISVKQSIDTLNLGVNYKFDWLAAFPPR